MVEVSTSHKASSSVFSKQNAGQHTELQITMYFWFLAQKTFPTARIQTGDEQPNQS